MDCGDSSDENNSDGSPALRRVPVPPQRDVLVRLVTPYASPYAFSRLPELAPSQDPARVDPARILQVLSSLDVLISHRYGIMCRYLRFAYERKPNAGAACL